MCLDPHALAKIEARCALRQVRARFEAMAASNAEESVAGLRELARLEHLLDRCDNCFTRERSVFLLDCAIRLLADLVFRWIGSSYCIQTATVSSRIRINDFGHVAAVSAAVGWHLPTGARGSAGHIGLLPFAGRERQARGERAAA